MNGLGTVHALFYAECASVFFALGDNVHDWKETERETEVMVDLNRRFSSDEVSAIVRRGLEHQSSSGDISYEELEDIALQSGISAQVLQQAIAAEEDHRERERAKAKWLSRRKTGFYYHLWPYVLVNAFLIAVNLMTAPDGYFWAIWPMLGWGLGLAFHAVSTFLPSERKLEREIRHQVKHKKKRHAHRRKRGREKGFSPHVMERKYSAN